MKPSHTLAMVIWLVALVVAIFSPSIQLQQGMPLPTVAVFLPVVFFTAAAFFMKSCPFDVAPLRRWIDAKLKDGSYAEFIRQLKPMLLFGVLPLIHATAAFLGSPAFNSALEAVWAQGFMISAGIGFLLMRAILARRGLSIESPSTSTPWAQREFLPQSIRNLRATKTSSFFTGGWTAIGMSGTENLLSSQDLDSYTRSGLWFAAAVIFFFVPIMLFVFGIHHSEMHEAAVFSRAGLRAALRLQGRMLVRGLYWMLGAVIISILFHLIFSVIS